MRATAQPPKSSTRIEVIDWLRGVAVVLMIQAHGFDAWLMTSAKTGAGYDVIRHLSGIPSRLFLFLVGVSMAIRFESQMAKGVSSQVMRRQAMKRGLQIVALAYLFRLQEYALAGFAGGWRTLFRVDILNAIGASALVLAVVAVPRAGRRAIVPCLVVAALFLGFGPIVGPANFPDWLPRPLTSYIGGQRPMSWFPLFPWGAWALVGVVVGHLWVRASHSPEGQKRIFLLSGAVGLALIGSVSLVRDFAPNAIAYPSHFIQQMGPGSFFLRLGIIGALAGLGWVAVTLWGTERHSPLRQLGRSSLLIYWIHVDLCYGGIARPIKGALQIPAATLGILILTAAMWGVSIFKERQGARVASAVRNWIQRR